MVIKYNSKMSDSSIGLYNSSISASLERLLKAKREDEYVNFNEVCRACLSSKNELTDMRDVTVGDMSVQDVFEKYISIPMSIYDNLPTQLCTNCLYELCRVYLFINNCREADAKLKDLVVKAEEISREEMYHSTIKIAENGKLELASAAKSDDSQEDLLKLGPLKVQEPGPPFICNNCSAHFDTLAEIKAHRTKNKHYIVRQYLCRICNPSKVFSYRHWRSHMRVHTGEKPYECPLCGRRFSIQGNKERHVLTHTGVKPFSCDICGKSFGQKTNLKLHHLRAHLGQKIEREKGEYTCERCGKVFSSKGALNQHRVIHDEKRFLCQECGKSFHYKLQFNLHMDGHRGVRRYKCTICNKAFTRPISLSLHKRTHTGHKPYECNQCDKRFAQRAHLVSHTRTHTGERPYSCPYCEKTFALNGNLTVHIRKHTGENPYVCDICNKGFTDSTSMKNHRKKHKQFVICAEENVQKKDEEEVHYEYVEMDEADEDLQDVK